MSKFKCLFCGSELKQIFCDLGTCPPSNSFIAPENYDDPELFYPLKTWICSDCLLVQAAHFKRPQEIFNHDYVYFSSYSSSWIKHAKSYVENVVKRFSLSKDSLIVEVGSNDGYLLQHVKNLGIPCLGIDPSSGAASVAQIKGIPTITDFFNIDLAKRLIDEGIKADLICGINVFAHVPDINNFVEAMEMLLKPNGIITMEFPYLKNLIEQTQFDTIYHEHYFYYTLSCVKKILENHKLKLFDVEELPTHGGSLRIYASKNNSNFDINDNAIKILENENKIGMTDINYYLNFQDKIEKIRFDLLESLLKIKNNGQKIAAYGAAKGNTLINYFGIRSDLIPYVVDASPHKQGLFLPGSRIPVVNEAVIKEEKPDYIFILPWNLKNEISTQLSYTREWGCKFITAIPQLDIF